MYYLYLTVYFTEKQAVKRTGYLNFIYCIMNKSSTSFLTEGSLSNTLNEKNNFPRTHNTRGRHSSLTMDTVRIVIRV